MDLFHWLIPSLAIIGLFREIEPRRFAVTPLAQTLLTDRPGTLHHLVLQEFTPIATRPDPEDLHTFRYAYGGISDWITFAVMNDNDFAGFRRIIDVGDANGAHHGAHHGADRRAGTTETEYRGLLEGAGFRYNRMIPTELPISILEAVAE